MKKPLFIVIILLIIFSCNKNDDPKTDKEYLIGTWTIKKVKTYYYLNGELDKIDETVFDKEPYSKLNFDSNQNVTYEDPDFTKIINGKWNLNNKNLKTDLKIDLGSSTGFGTQYFFPENNIIEINDVELILKSPMSLETTDLNGGKFKYYNETFFQK